MMSPPGSPLTCLNGGGIRLNRRELCEGFIDVLFRNDSARVHPVGSFEIDGGGDEATVVWRWIVSWKAEQTGTVSTGTYSDKFQKRNGQWKCLERTSQVDPNWPAALFQPFVDREKETFRES
jgi:hypothetical protein